MSEMIYKCHQRKRYPKAGKLLVFAFATLAGLLSFQSCELFRDSSREDALARVYNQYLFRSDLNGVVPPNTSPADSALLVQRFVDNWVQQQVLVREASRRLPSAETNFEKQLQDYRNSLTIYAFENHQVRNLLDTIISDQEIADFYEQNLEVFQLKESIVRISYVKVPLDAPDANQIGRLIRQEDGAGRLELEEYCLQHAATYLLDADSWLIFNDFLREMPVQTNNPEQFLRSNSFVELSDQYYRYYLRIHEYKLKGTTSPLVFERDNIRNTLVNKRRMQFLSQMRQTLYQEALDDKRVQTFY